MSRALSIVVPCYNEEACLPSCTPARPGGRVAVAGDDYEIVLVNDGSRDRSWEIMRELAADRSPLVADQPVTQPWPPAGADRRARPLRAASGS